MDGLRWKILAINFTIYIVITAVEIANKMKLPKELCNIIHIGGLLHDIGKVGIPEHILTKPGKLTDEEFKLIKAHPTIGYEMIKKRVSPPFVPLILR